MRNKLFSVTIAIPAHNESQNIYDLLTNLVHQRQYTFVLDNIFVVCDGCTDNTVELARQLSNHYPVIKVLDDSLRKGKSQRLNEIYQQNKSDIIITLDGDCMPSNAYVINEM